MRNSGIYVVLPDGRKGVAYSKEQIRGDKLLIKLIQKDFSPLLSEKTGKQAVVFRLPSDVKIIGYCD
jgi:hypothetical protein